MNVEHRTLNAQRRIMYSVNLIKDSVSLLRRSGYESRQRFYNSNFCGSLAIKSIKRSVINIQCSMLGVRCSTFKAFRPPGGVTAPVWRNLIRSFIRGFLHRPVKFLSIAGQLHITLTVDLICVSCPPDRHTSFPVG